MSKKIVVLNGSPRPKGNTAALIDQFVKGAGEAGHQVSRFDLFKMDIHPCLGSFRFTYVLLDHQRPAEMRS